jgi:hypothetical protein
VALGRIRVFEPIAAVPVGPRAPFTSIIHRSKPSSALSCGLEFVLSPRFKAPLEICGCQLQFGGVTWPTCNARDRSGRAQNAKQAETKSNYLEKRSEDVEKLVSAQLSLTQNASERPDFDFPVHRDNASLASAHNYVAAHLAPTLDPSFPSARIISAPER